MALIPFTVPRRTYGTAYGVVEVLGAVSSFAGNVLIGYLLDRAGTSFLYLPPTHHTHLLAQMSIYPPTHPPPTTQTGGQYETTMFALTALAAGGMVSFFLLLFSECCFGHNGLNSRTCMDVEAMSGLDE